MASGGGIEIGAPGVILVRGFGPDGLETGDDEGGLVIGCMCYAKGPITRCAVRTVPNAPPMIVSLNDGGAIRPVPCEVVPVTVVA